MAAPDIVTKAADAIRQVAGRLVADDAVPDPARVLDAIGRRDGEHAPPAVLQHMLDLLDHVAESYAAGAWKVGLHDQVGHAGSVGAVLRAAMEHDVRRLPELDAFGLEILDHMTGAMSDGTVSFGRDDRAASGETLGVLACRRAGVALPPAPSEAGVRP